MLYANNFKNIMPCHSHLCKCLDHIYWIVQLIFFHDFQYVRCFFQISTDWHHVSHVRYEWSKKCITMVVMHCCRCWQGSPRPCQCLPFFRHYSWSQCLQHLLPFWYFWGRKVSKVKICIHITWVKSGVTYCCLALCPFQLLNSGRPKQKQHRREIKVPTKENKTTTKT